MLKADFEKLLAEMGPESETTRIVGLIRHDPADPDHLKVSPSFNMPFRPCRWIRLYRDNIVSINRMGIGYCFHGTERTAYPIAEVIVRGTDEVSRSFLSLFQAATDALDEVAHAMDAMEAAAGAEEMRAGARAICSQHGYLTGCTDTASARRAASSHNRNSHGGATWASVFRC